MKIATLTLVLGLGLVGCADDVEVGRDEAIEILVLDGIERDKAVCIVDRIEGDVALERLTGVDPNITDEELATVAAVTAGCRIVGDENPTIVEDEPFGGRVEGGLIDVAVDERVDDLITGGLAPEVALCVGAAISGSSEPGAMVDDDNFVAEAIRVCEG